MINVIVIIPEHNTGSKLCEYLNNKYGVTATLWRDIQGIEEVETDAFIIYRKCVDSLEILDEVKGKVALLYGTAPVPTADRVISYNKLTGTLPGCVNGFVESLIGQAKEHQSDLTWGEYLEDYTPGSSKSWSSIRSIALFSPGGGVGKTTTGVHLAKLAEQANVNVGLIETDEDKGGVLRYLGKPPALEGLDSLEKHIWDNEELFKENIERLVQKVGRIQVVPMVSTFGGLSCNVKNVSSLFRWAESRFSLTLYDLPPRLRDVMTFSVLQEVDQVILVAEPTEVLLDALQKHMLLCQEVEQFRNLPSKYRLLVNKVPEKDGLRPEEMADALGLPLLGAIPADIENYDRIINRAKFEIPVDSPWRTVFANLDLGGRNSIVPINSNIDKRIKNTPAKSKARKGLLSFFFA